MRCTIGLECELEVDVEINGEDRWVGEVCLFGEPLTLTDAQLDSIYAAVNWTQLERDMDAAERDRIADGRIHP